MRQVRRVAEARASRQRSGRSRSEAEGEPPAGHADDRTGGSARPAGRGREAQVLAWQ